MILIINICKEKLHDYEFVKPIADILERKGIEGKIVYYLDLNKKDIEGVEKIIICGTSLQDDEFFNNLNKFEWIKSIDKPVLGICAGMQIISLVFGGRLKKKTEIGFYKENFINDFLGLKGKEEVYHLHNNYVSFPNNFKRFSKSKIPQAIKHKEKEIYGCLFHPEVRQKEIISHFCKLK